MRTRFCCLVTFLAFGLIGLMSSVSVGADPLLEGWVRLDSGEPVAEAQVKIFDVTDLRQGAIVRTMTDGTGYFALPLAALGGRALPVRFALGPNYPNPFNPSTIIPYQLAASAAVRLEVFNLLGQHIATLVDGERPAGFHTAMWHAVDATGRAVGAGVYIYRMTVGMERQTGRMVLLDGQAGLAASGVASVMPGVSGVGGSDGQVYGLVVSGSGLVPYVDSSFRVEAGMAPVELVVSSGPHPAGKATDDDCALCDLFGTFNPQEEEAETEEEEAETDSTSIEGGPDLIVQSPSVNNSILTPGQEFILHATVHNQGDEQAAATMLRYYRSNNATITASDTEVGTDEIGVLDASATSAQSIELTAPTGGAPAVYYGACVGSVSGESNTDNNCSSAVRITVSGQVATEEEEETTEEEGEEEAPETPPEEAFNIELVFEDDFPEWEKVLIQDSKRHWEKQLNDIPDYTLKQDVRVFGSYIPAGTVVDDILIYVSTRPRHASGHNWGSAVLFREDSGLPVVGEIQLVLKRWSYEEGRMAFPDPAMSQLEGPYHEYVQSFTALHEIGHALGIGSGENWHNLLREGAEHPYFAGERAIAAYNALPRLVRVDYHPQNLTPWGGVSINIFGYDKPIVSDQPGGLLYRGDKVPLHGGSFGGGGHWGVTTGQELMSYGTSRPPYHAYIYSYGLSTISLGALEDMGYPVRHGFADPFWVTVDEDGDPIFPISAGKPSIFLGNDPADRCGVGKEPH